MTRVGAIWAQDRGGILGAGGNMLWRVPDDFRHFKAVTLGGVVIMGRTTWESIGAALPGRRCLVLTTQESWSSDGAITVHRIPDAIAQAREYVNNLGEDPRIGRARRCPRVWVIGGGQVYAQALTAGVVDEVLVSVLDCDVSSRAAERGYTSNDVVYAPVLSPSQWRLRSANEPSSCADTPGVWRPRSGDAAWRVDHYCRRDV